MKRRNSDSGSCPSNCLYASRSQLPSVQHLIETGSKVDRLYYGKYLPLRERKLLGKLIRTRAVYDDVRNQLLSTSGSSELTRDTRSEDDSTERSSAVVKLVDLVDRGQIGSSGTSKLSNTCSCCSCGSMHKIRIDKHPRIHRHSVPYDAIAKYTVEAKKKGLARRNRLSTRVSSRLRAVRFKLKHARSAPCSCTLNTTSMNERPSKTRLKKSRSKVISTSTAEAPAKTVKIDRKAIKCLCKLPLKSIRSMKSTKTSSMSGDSEGQARRRFRIKKDSLMLFREKLKKKAPLKDWECEPGVCVPDECIPEDCYKKIKGRSVGGKRKKIYPSKASGTDLTQSHVSISTKKKVSNVNVGKRVKKIDTKCMCPAKMTSSETNTDVRNEVISKKEEPRVVGENIRIQTEKKQTKIKKTSHGRKDSKNNKKSKHIQKQTSHHKNDEEEKSQLPNHTSKTADKTSKLTDQTIKHSYKKNIPVQKESQPEIFEEPQYTTEELESHPSRQAVNIGSSFSFNVEFYKEGSPNIDAPDDHNHEVIREERYDSSPRITKQRVHRIKKRQRSSQSISSISKKSTNIGHGLKRCFCTLKIPKRKQKPSRPTSRKTMTSLYSRKVDVVGRMKETQTKPFKNHGASVVYVTPPLTSKPRSSLPYRCECESKVRLPNENESQYLPEETKALRKPKKSILTLPSQYMSNSVRKSESPKPKYRKTKRPPTVEVEKSEISLNRSNRQGVRIGSTFSFNIEFSKEKIGYEPEIIEIEETINRETTKEKQPRIEKKRYREKGIKVHKPRLRHIPSQTMKTEKSKQTHTAPAIDKCICPSNILKEKSTRINKCVCPSIVFKEQSTGMESCVCPPHLLKEQSTVTPLDYTEKSKLLRHRAIATDKKRNRNQATLLPYECEPGVCIPDECDPYECEKLIKMRTSSKSRHSQISTRKKKGVRRKEKVIVQTPSQSSKQVVRIGSSFSFNIEFYKEKSPAGGSKTVKVINDKTAGDKVHRHTVKRAKLKEAAVQGFERRAHDESSNTETRVREKGISVSSAIKRCFCTLKLHKKEERLNKKKKGNANTPERRSSATLGLRSNGDNSTNIVLKPKYCKADICDSHECCKETNQQHRKRLKHHHTDNDRSRRKPTVNINTAPKRTRSKKIESRHIKPEMKNNQVYIQHEQNMRHRQMFVPKQSLSSSSIQRSPNKYNQYYIQEEQIIHRRIPRQTRRVGSIFDFNIQVAKQRSHTKSSLGEYINSTPGVQPRKKVKTNRETIKVNTKQPPVIKVEKEHKTCNVGPKLKNAMGAFTLRLKEIGLRIKKIKLRRSVSQYTMVKVKKAKPGEPVTAAFFQVIRDVDYRAKESNLYNESHSKYKYQKEIRPREDKERGINISYSKQRFHKTYSVTKDFSDGLYEEDYEKYSISRYKQNSVTKFSEKYMQSRSSKRSIRYDSCIHFDIKSNVSESIMINTSESLNIRENKFKINNNTQAITSPYKSSYYALNVQVPYTGRQQNIRNTVKYECEPGFYVPGKCNPLARLKQINSFMKSTKSSETEHLKHNSMTSSTDPPFGAKFRTTQSNLSSTLQQRSSKAKSAIRERLTSNQFADPSRQSLYIGSTLSFKAEFYKKRKAAKGKPTYKPKSTKSYGANKHIQQATITVCNLKKPCKSTKLQKRANNKNRGSMLERCFCTLKLKKKVAGSTENGKKHSNGSKKNETKDGRCPTSKDKLGLCDTCTYPYNNGNDTDNDTRIRRKRSKYTKVHSRKHNISVKSDIMKKELAIKAKRFSRSFESEVHAWSSDTFGLNEFHKKYRARSLKGVVEPLPKNDIKAELVAYNNNKRSSPSLLQRCVCALTYRMEYDRNDLTQKQNQVELNTKQKSHKSKLKTQLQNEYCDLAICKEIDVGTIMPPTKKTLKKPGSDKKSKQKISENKNLHSDSLLCRCSKKFKGKDTNEIKKTLKKRGGDKKSKQKTAENKNLHSDSLLCRCSKKFRNKDTNEINKNFNQSDKAVNTVKKYKKQVYTQSIAKDTEPVIKNTKSKNAKQKRADSKGHNMVTDNSMCTPPHVVPLFDMMVNKDDMTIMNKGDFISILESSSGQKCPPFTNNMEIDTITKSKNNKKKKVSKNVKDKLPSKSRAKLDKTERKNDHSIRTSEGEIIKKHVKKQKSHKKTKRYAKPKPDNSYHGLYPCCRSDEEINKTLSIKEETRLKNEEAMMKKGETMMKEDGLCLMCEHSQDTKTLAAKLLDSGKLFMNKNLTLIKAKCEAEKQDTSPPQTPLFEMVVNKGDMQIMNKEEIITKIKSPGGQKYPPFTNNMEIDTITNSKDKKKNKVPMNVKDKLPSKPQAKLHKTERKNDYSIETYEGEIIKKQKHHKKPKQFAKPKPDNSYHGLYPCCCSDEEINKTLSIKQETRMRNEEAMMKGETIMKEDGLYPMCKHCQDKKTLAAKLLENGKLFMDKILTVIKARCEAEKQDTSPPQTPLFEMVVNKGDMQIMNKEEIITKIKSPGGQKYPPFTNNMEIDTITNSKDKKKNKVPMNVKDKLPSKPQAKLHKTERKNDHSIETYEGEIIKKQKYHKKPKPDNSYHGLYPCCCSDEEINKTLSIKEETRMKNEEAMMKGETIMKEDGLYPMCKHCQDKKTLAAKLLENGKLFMNKILTVIKARYEAEKQDTSPPQTPLFEMVVNKGDMKIMNKDDIITKIKSPGGKPDDIQQGENAVQRDDGLCPMCKHSEDKKPLSANLLENGKLLVEAIKNMLMTLRAKYAAKKQDPSGPEMPVFEMVVNKGDMSVTNKQDVIAKIKSSSDRHQIPATTPSFQIVVNNSDATIVNTDETRNRLVKYEKNIKNARSKNIKSKSLKYEIPMKTPVNGIKSKRQSYSLQIHGKNCKCCYCANKKQIKNEAQQKIGYKRFMDGMPAYSKKAALRPCICGSVECKKELKQEMKTKQEEEKRAKRKPCVCGSKICKDGSKKDTKPVAHKAKSKSKKVKKKDKQKEKPKPKSQKPDFSAIGSLLCGKITFHQFKYKIMGTVETEEEKRERLKTEKEQKKQEERKKRKQGYAKDDAKRRKARIKTDKVAMKDVKKYKGTPDAILCAESLLDVGKLGLHAVTGVVRTTFRALRDPKGSLLKLKELASDTEHALRTVKETIAGSGVAGTASRIKCRVGSMSRTQSFISTMESHPCSNYVIHFADKDPKKRIAKHRRGKRVREPLDFECSLFMASMRKRPHLWVYYMCPWFYPHCISLLGVWRQFTDVLLFLLAVAVWSPCIFAMEACRAMMCCFLCTG